MYRAQCSAPQADTLSFVHLAGGTFRIAPGGAADLASTADAVVQELAAREPSNSSTPAAVYVVRPRDGAAAGDDAAASDR